MDFGIERWNFDDHWDWMSRDYTSIQNTGVVHPGKPVFGRKWCQRQELNLRPKAYESSALPLSYSGNRRVLHFANILPSVKPEAYRVVGHFSFFCLSSPKGGQG